LAEHEHLGANITRLGDCYWWAVVTLATVGYVDYYPVTLVGRIVAIIMMLSGIGIFVLLVSTLAQRRLEKEESRLEQRRLLGHDAKTIIKSKIEEMEKLTEEDFDTLITTMKGLRRTLLVNSILSYHDGSVRTCQ
jgi:voltage-gated potassium channel